MSNYQIIDGRGICIQAIDKFEFENENNFKFVKTKQLWHL